MTAMGIATRAQAAVRQARWIARRALRKPPRILVEIRWRLGDEVMAIPIYEGIKRRYPFCHLTVWCNYPELLIRNPHVDAVIGPKDDPTNADCDRLLLLRDASRYEFRLDAYARNAGIPTPSMNPRLYYEDWSVKQLAYRELRNKDFIAVCTGGTWETKRWPAERWQALCDALSADGERIVQLGHNDARLSVSDCMVDETSIYEAACMLRSAKLLITTDSGLLHLALAVGTPVLGLFGPTKPSILVREGEFLTALTNGRECQGCWNGFKELLKPGVCPLGISPCMETLNVDPVLGRARELLKRD